MPPADNSRYLAQAAQQPSRDTRQRALAAIAALAGAGGPVTPTTVARRAGVSRQWLYTCEEAMAAIDAARADGPTAPPPPGRTASAASLKRRLEATTDTNKQLRRRVTELEAQVATLYGQLRALQQLR